MSHPLTLINAGVRITHRQRVRTMRTQRHLAVAFLAGMACAFIAPVAGTVLWITLIPILAFVVLNSLARAIDARLGYWWGWLYGEPKRPTWVDRMVDRIIHRLAAAKVDDPPMRVRPLDPESRQ